MFNPHSALIKALLYLELWRWEHLEPRAARTAKSILCNSHLNHATKQLYFTCAYNYHMLWTARHWWLAKTTSAWIRSWSLCVRPCNCVSTEATRTLHLNTLELEVQYDCVAEQKCHNQMLQIMRWGFTNISSPWRSWQNLLQLLCKYIDIYMDLIDCTAVAYELSSLPHIELGTLSGVGDAQTKSSNGWHKMRLWIRNAADWTPDNSDAFTVKGIAEKEFGPRGSVRIHVEFTGHDSTWYYTVGYDSDQLLCLLLAQALIRACRRLVRQFLMKRGPQRWVNLCQSMPVQRRVQLCRYKRAYQHISYLHQYKTRQTMLIHFTFWILYSIGFNWWKWLRNCVRHDPGIRVVYEGCGISSCAVVLFFHVFALGFKASQWKVSKWPDVHSQMSRNHTVAWYAGGMKLCLAFPPGTINWWKPWIADTPAWRLVGMMQSWRATFYIFLRLVYALFAKCIEYVENMLRNHEQSRSASSQVKPRTFVDTLWIRWEEMLGAQCTGTLH